MSEMSSEMKDAVSNFFTLSKDSFSDYTVLNFFDVGVAYLENERKHWDYYGGQRGGENEELKIVVRKTKDTLGSFKPLFSTLENFVDKVIIYLKDGIQGITSRIQIPEALLQFINDIYEKYFSNNQIINNIVECFSNIRDAIEVLYNLDYRDSGTYTSIVDAVANQENVNRLLELIKEKNKYLSDKLIFLRDIIYPVFTGIYNNKFFKKYILELANAYVKINENQKIKDLRDKENAFTNNTVFNFINI